MDRLTKFILACAIAFLALIIVLGINKGKVSKEEKTISLPPEALIVPKQAKKQTEQIKPDLKKPQEQEEGETHSPYLDFSDQQKPPRAHLEKYHPGYIPDKYLIEHPREEFPPAE